MLYVTYLDRLKMTTRQWAWHVGEPLPPKPGPYEIVEMVQADSDELSYIVGSFNGIPFVLNKRVQRWPQPWAQFIVENLP